MHLSIIFAALLSAHTSLATTPPPSSTRTSSASSTASATNVPGYNGPGSYITPTITGSNLTFGQHYAVLNLDLVNLLVGGVASTSAGQAFINNTASWIDLVHTQKPAPLSIFTRIYFANERKPEIKPNGPFFRTSQSFTTANQTSSQIYPAFRVDAAAGDLVLQKTGYYAGYGNNLENILAAQGIDTVILSGVRTSGVILSTTYRLFDLGYNVYIIANNTIETPPNGPSNNLAILQGIVPKLAANVITIEQAAAALARSGPAIY